MKTRTMIRTKMSGKQSNQKSGSVMTEYVILVTLIAAVCIGVAGRFGRELQESINDITEHLNAAKTEQLSTEGRNADR